MHAITHGLINAKLDQQSCMVRRPYCSPGVMQLSMGLATGRSNGEACAAASRWMGCA